LLIDVKFRIFSVTCDLSAVLGVGTCSLVLDLYIGMGACMLKSTYL